MTDIAADTTTTAAVAVGGSVGGSATGDIEQSGERDWFVIERVSETTGNQTNRGIK